MSSFSVGKGEGYLKTPGAMREFKTELIEPSASKEDFLETLNGKIDEVNALQKNADIKMQELATGETNNIPEVMMAVEKADIAMKLMVSVRNKMIDAYQEIMRMQV